MFPIFRFSLFSQSGKSNHQQYSSRLGGEREAREKKRKRDDAVCECEREKVNERASQHYICVCVNACVYVWRALPFPHHPEKGRTGEQGTHAHSPAAAAAAAAERIKPEKGAEKKDA